MTNTPVSETDEIDEEDLKPLVDLSEQLLDFEALGTTPAESVEVEEPSKHLRKTRKRLTKKLDKKTARAAKTLVERNSTKDLEIISVANPDDVRVFLDNTDDDLRTVLVIGILKLASLESPYTGFNTVRLLPTFGEIAVENLVNTGTWDFVGSSDLVELYVTESTLKEVDAESGPLFILFNWLDGVTTDPPLPIEDPPDEA